MKKQPCPRCGQDWLRKVEIGAIERTVWLCYECEATWACDCHLDFATFVDLTIFLARHGKEPTKVVYDTFKDLDT